MDCGASIQRWLSVEHNSPFGRTKLMPHLRRHGMRSLGLVLALSLITMIGKRYNDGGHKTRPTILTGEPADSKYSRKSSKIAKEYLNEAFRFHQANRFEEAYTSYKAAIKGLGPAMQPGDKS